MPDFHSCCFPYVISLQKGLLKINSGDLHSGTILEVDTYSLQPVQLDQVLAAVQPKHYMVTQSAKRWSRPRDCCEPAMPWGGFAAGVHMAPLKGEATHFDGDQLRQEAPLLGSCHWLAVWRWLRYFTSQIQLGQLFSNLTPFCQKMQHFTNSFIRILFWMELYPKWSVFPQNRGQLFCPSTVISPFTYLAPKLWGQRCFLLHEMIVVCTAEPWCSGANLNAIVVQTAAITLIESNTVSV